MQRLAVRLGVSAPRFDLVEDLVSEQVQRVADLADFTLAEEHANANGAYVRRKARKQVVFELALWHASPAQIGHAFAQFEFGADDLCLEVRAGRTVQRLFETGTRRQR